jgi:hypothetical protein
MRPVEALEDLRLQPSIRGEVHQLVCRGGIARHAAREVKLEAAGRRAIATI